jgi:AraC-like DNA-binding protein
MDVLGPASPDPVADALRSLNVRSSIFCLSELCAPWGFRVDGSKVAKFHVVLAGSAILEVDGGDPITVTEGDVILLPRGDAHTISGEQGSAIVPMQELLVDHVDGHTRLRYGGSGGVTRLLCGGFTISDHLLDSTVALLPDVVRVDAGSVASTVWLEPVLTTLESEAVAGQLGADAILAKIADVFLAQALRAWLVGAERAGLLVAGALHDGPIANAVQALRLRFAEPWTLQLLAKHVGLSRSGLATRFRRLVGQPPMRYLAKVRLSQAAGYLATSHLSIYEIARLTGYDNDATLSKAFRREFGRPPGSYRDNVRRRPVVHAELSRV